jgi:hypothetical protein
VPHNSIAACLARSRSGCMRAANGVVAVVDTWRLSQSRKSSSMIANSEPLIGSMWSSLMIRSSPDLSASRTTAAALPLLALMRWRTSAMASPNDSNGVVLLVTLFSTLVRARKVIGHLFLRHAGAAGSGGRPLMPAMTQKWPVVSRTRSPTQHCSCLSGHPHELNQDGTLSQIDRIPAVWIDTSERAAVWLNRDASCVAAQQYAAINPIKGFC